MTAGLRRTRRSPAHDRRGRAAGAEVHASAPSRSRVQSTRRRRRDRRTRATVCPTALVPSPGVGTTSSAREVRSRGTAFCHKPETRPAATGLVLTGLTRSRQAGVFQMGKRSATNAGGVAGRAADSGRVGRWRSQPDFLLVGLDKLVHDNPSRFERSGVLLATTAAMTPASKENATGLVPGFRTLPVRKRCARGQGGPRCPWSPGQEFVGWADTYTASDEQVGAFVRCLHGTGRKPSNRDAMFQVRGDGHARPACTGSAGRSLTDWVDGAGTNRFGVHERHEVVPVRWQLLERQRRE